MNRRGFMAGILALGAAPAIVRVGSIMRVAPLVFHPDAFSLVVPPIGNKLITFDEITREALRILFSEKLAAAAPELALIHDIRRGTWSDS